MRSGVGRTVVWCTVMALLAAACSGGDEVLIAAPTTTAATTTTTAPPSTTSTSTSTTTTTTTLPFTTTTTIYPGPWSPLNGLPAEEQVIDRRVIAVKIDNHPDARPQTGLASTDVVYELIVEGGLTRFIALFQTESPDKIRPIRSGRPTDPTLVRYLDAPLQISGAQAWVVSYIRSTGVRLIGDNAITTFRDRPHFSPHNLYGSVAIMRDYADDRAYPDESPDAIFAFGDPANGEAATKITMDWSTRPEVIWEWDGTSYLRFNVGEPHMWITDDGDVEQVAVPTLLVLTARKYTANPPSKGSSVPALDTVETGQALLFQGGMAIAGTWARDSISQPFALTLADGSTMVVPRGQLWISVFPSQQTVTWE